MTTQYCSKCGEQLIKQARFCKACGTAVNTAAASKRKKTRKDNRSLPLVIGGAVLLLLAVWSISTLPPKAQDPVNIPDQHDADGLPYPDVVRATVDEVKTGVDTDTAIIVDVRSPEAYQASHITGAISMPLDEIGSRYQELPQNQMIFLYCT